MRKCVQELVSTRTWSTRLSKELPPEYNPALAVAGVAAATCAEAYLLVTLSDSKLTVKAKKGRIDQCFSSLAKQEQEFRVPVREGVAESVNQHAMALVLK